MYLALARRAVLARFLSFLSFASWSRRKRRQRRTCDFADVAGHLAMLTVFTNAAVSQHLTEISFGCKVESMPIDYPLFLAMLKSRRRNTPCAFEYAASLSCFGPGPDSVTLAGL
ncbi:hypothetical protein FB45DRAFT_945379, partial [Roridomyces roridus]